jgi:hypothetical protein
MCARYPGGPQWVTIARISETGLVLSRKKNYFSEIEVDGQSPKSQVTSGFAWLKNRDQGCDYLYLTRPNVSALRRERQVRWVRAGP